MSIDRECQKFEDGTPMLSLPALKHVLKSLSVRLLVGQSLNNPPRLLVEIGHNNSFPVGPKNARGYPVASI